MKNKKFDCVIMMRDIRDKLSIEYLKNPELQKKRLAKIRKRYHLKEKVNVK